MVRLRARLGKREGQTGTLLRGATKAVTLSPNCRKHRGDHPRKSCRPSLTFKAFLRLLVSLPNTPMEAPIEHSSREEGYLSLKNNHIQLLTKYSF